MSLSDHEQYVLEELDREFHASPSSELAPWPSRALTSWRVPLAAVGLPLGLLLMFVALVANSAAGVVLALGAYALLVFSSAILVNRSADLRGARAQQALAARRPWYLR